MSYLELKKLFEELVSKYQGMNDYERKRNVDLYCTIRVISATMRQMEEGIRA